MQLVTVGAKYQVVIPKSIRKNIKAIQPGSKVGVQLSDEGITLKPIPKNWSDLNYGKFKKYLKGADEEVEKMRDEWEERLKELGRGYVTKKP